MSKIAVLGLGRFGYAVATNLYRHGAEVLAVDRTPKLVEALVHQVTVGVSFDATDSTNLAAYDVASMDAVVVAIGSNFEASVLVTMQCKALGVPRVYAKALNEEQEAVLLRVGADHVIKPEGDMGERLADHLLHDSVVDFVELPEGYSLRRIQIPADWADKSLAELSLLAEKKLNLIQVLRARDTFGDDGKPEIEKMPLPHGSMVLRDGDRVDVIGPDRTLLKYE